MSLKLQKKIDEAINDELAYTIVMKHVVGANGLVAAIGVHQILEKMRKGEYTKDYTIGYCNMTLRKGLDDMVLIKIPNKNGLTHNFYAYNLTTGKRFFAKLVKNGDVKKVDWIRSEVASNHGRQIRLYEWQE